MDFLTMKRQVITFLGPGFKAQMYHTLLFDNSRGQRHRPDKTMPRNKDGYRLMTFDAKDYIERLAMPVPWFLRAKDIDKRVASTHWLHYPPLARGSSQANQPQQLRMPVRGPTARHLR